MGECCQKICRGRARHHQPRVSNCKSPLRRSKSNSWSSGGTGIHSAKPARLRDPKTQGPKCSRSFPHPSDATGCRTLQASTLNDSSSEAPHRSLFKRHWGEIQGRLGYTQASTSTNCKMCKMGTECEKNIRPQSVGYSALAPHH